ncbi:DUF2232 domain-containing protein [Peribacillus frigoritolerans]|nr:DUF2232 domain-containing protein [Peribacillus frigoritolerans]
MNSGRRIAEGGALLALYCILLFITIQIPLLGIFTDFLFTHSIHSGHNQTKVIVEPWLLICSLVIVDPHRDDIVCSADLAHGGQRELRSVIFLKKDKPMAPMFISAVLVFLGGILLIYAASVLITDVNYIEESMNMAEESLENTIGIMDSFGQAPTDQVKKRMYESIDMMNTLMPSLFVLMSVIMVLLIFFAAHPIVKRFSDKALKWPHFSRSATPEKAFYGII